MNTAEATLDSFPLLNATAVTWPQIDGTKPVKRVFYMETGTAQALMKKRKGGTSDRVALKVIVDGLPLWEAQALYVLGLVPTHVPQITGVLVADQRVWWPSVNVSMACNVPRRVGKKPLQAEGNPIELTQFADDVQYAPWSLNPETGKAWTASEMAIEVLFRVIPVLGGNYVVANIPRTITVQGVQFADSGDLAIERALGYLSGMAVNVGLDGIVRVRDARDGTEAQLATSGPPIVGAQLAALVDHSLIRPSSITVLFEREIELRLDSIDEDKGQVAGSGAVNNINDYRGMENVGLVTDLSLALPAMNGLAKAVVPRGTWIGFPRLSAAWQASPVPFQVNFVTPATGPVLGIKWIRVAYNSRGIFQDAIQTPGAPSWVLAARVDSAFTHFRRTFRFPAKYLDRISRIYPYRAALLDPVTGTRAPASVYCDFARLFTVRGALLGAATGTQGAGPTSLSYRFDWQNIPGYNASLSAAMPAPFSLDVIDEQQGIIQLRGLLDPFGRTTLTIPGFVVGPDGTNPCSSDPRDAGPNRPGILTAYASLKSGFKCSVVLTVVPASPNDNRRFQQYQIKPISAEKLLGIKIGKCLGPPMTVRIPPNTAVARIPWLDSHAAAVDAAMGVPGNSGGVLPTPINDLQCAAVAASLASQIWAQDVDRWEGGVTLPLDPAIQPKGNAGAISHVLQPDGKALTVVAFPPQPPMVDLLSILPDGARRLTQGLVEQRGASGS